MVAKLYDHQTELVEQGLPILQKYKLLYLAGEVRTGKTLASLHVASRYLSDKGSVLFLTKKKAIQGINESIAMSGLNLDFVVTNYEQVHKIVEQRKKFDIVIIDEAHNMGAYPKPAKRQKAIRSLCMGLPIILLSGTPSPESYSQLFHQFQLSVNSPWSEYRSFYIWARKYVDVFQKTIGSMEINDYSIANEALIKADIKKYMLTKSQEEAGFESYVEEKFLYVPMTPDQLAIYKQIEKDLVTTHNDIECIVGSGADLINKLCQISSGTLKYDDTYSRTISVMKAHFINMQFQGKKLAIAYRYKQEFEILKEFFPNWTNDSDQFNKSTDMTYLGQMSSMREGVNVSTADELIMYNIDFSATTYFQIRARTQNKEKTRSSRLWWVFSEGGIERKIYKAVVDKKNFTHSYYKQIK